VTARKRCNSPLVHAVARALPPGGVRIRGGATGQAPPLDRIVQRAMQDGMNLPAGPGRQPGLLEFPVEGVQSARCEPLQAPVGPSSSSPASPTTHDRARRATSARPALVARAT
jgi:hypothetical protein